MSGSCARSHSMTRGAGVSFVGSLRMLASIQYFTGTSQCIRGLRADRHEEVLLRTIEHLPRFDTVHLQELCWQDDLALGGDGSLYKSKMLTYL